MKKTCICLLLLICAVYLKQGYEIMASGDPVNNFTSGSLSDIAEEVIAIPLETNNRCMLTHAKQIKRDKNELFLVCNRELYHFDCSGKFISQITQNHHFLVADYVIDPVNKQLVVLDKDEKVHYYNYSGELLATKNPVARHPWNRLIKLAYHDQHIWATTENLTCRDDNKVCLEKWLYKFDTDFREVEANKLTPANLGRLFIDGSFSPEPAVANNQVYVHAPSMQPDQLLQDTLFLINRNNLSYVNNQSILPLRISNRFLISTYYNANTADNNYIFCFDQREKHSYTMKGGFEDNFYQTGQVAELQSMDIYNTSYCYYKTGEEVKKAFPDRKEGDNPVLFIVKLKG